MSAITLVASGLPESEISILPVNVLPANVPVVMRQVMAGLQPDVPVPMREPVAKA